MIQGRLWKVAKLRSVLGLVVHRDLFRSWYCFFFPAAFPIQFRVYFPTVTMVMYEVLYFKICPVLEQDTAFSQTYFTITALNYCFICLDYFLPPIIFLQIYLATSIPGVIGSWSTQGCKVKETHMYKGFVTCECNHLTNFALLLDVSQTRYMSQGLSTITWIGCGLSMAGLALTIITFLYLK